MPESGMREWEKSSTTSGDREERLEKRQLPGRKLNLSDFAGCENISFTQQSDLSSLRGCGKSQ
jgi:hypothetical protein